MQRLRMRICLLVIVHEAEDVHAGELVAAVEEVEFDGDREADDLAAELRTHLHKGSRVSRVDAVIEHELAESEADSLAEFKIEGAW